MQPRSREYLTRIGRQGFQYVVLIRRNLIAARQRGMSLRINSTSNV